MADKNKTDIEVFEEIVTLLWGFDKEARTRIIKAIKIFLEIDTLHCIDTHARNANQF